MQVERMYISAYSGTRTEYDNARQHRLFDNVLQVSPGVKSYGVLKGVYAGVSELSYLVLLTNPRDHTQPPLKGWLLELMSYFKQECVLLQSPDNECMLMFNDGRTQMLGLMQVLDQPEEGDYSYVLTAPRACPELANKYLQVT